MSSAVSPLGGKVAPGEVSVRDTGLRGMISLRGDLSDAKLRSLCTEITGQSFPVQRTAQCAGETGLYWMAPDEVLVLLPYGEAAQAVARIDSALAGTHYLVANVSDARAVLRVEGPFCREVLAKLAPVDLHPDTFKPGQIRRTRLGQIAAAFWMRDDASFEVICFRSVAGYAFDLLAASAAAGPVGAFADP